MDSKRNLSKKLPQTRFETFLGLENHKIRILNNELYKKSIKRSTPDQIRNRPWAKHHEIRILRQELYRSIKKST